MNPALELLSQRADQAWEAGNLRSAFRLFLRAAKAGEIGCQLNLGTFYCHGIGVKPNREKALYWYRRAYKLGYSPAASNIACVYRDEDNQRKTLEWFQRAVNLGDVEANLNIAKILLDRGEKKQAIRRLRLVAKAKPYVEVTADSWEQARRILRRLERVPR